MTIPETPILLLALLFVGVVLLVEGVWIWWRDVQAPKNRASQRVRRLSAGAMEEEIEAQLYRRETRGSGPFAGITTWLARKLSQADIKMSPQRLLLAMAAGFILVMVVLPVLLGFADRLASPAVLLMLVVVSFTLSVGLPLVFIERQADRRIKLLERQFPLALDIFVRGLRAGHPVSRSFELLVAEMPDPIAGEFAQVIAEVNYGFDLRDALQNFADRVQSPDVQMFVVSVAIQSETGGNLAEILEGLAQVIRERHSMKLKVRALSSEGRMTAVVLSVLPVLTFVGIFLVAPNFFLDVADDPWFLPGLSLVFLLYLAGVLMIRRMVDVRV
ncbi:MAG: type II secretion system F family protein [Thermaurantiacus sp.]